MKRLLAAAVLALGLVGVAHAAIDTYEFANDAERERFRDLTKELRCPKCQNQDIADSNAPIAADLRKEIFRMLGRARTTSRSSTSWSTATVISCVTNRRSPARPRCSGLPRRAAAGRCGGDGRDRPPPPRRACRWQ